jgi:myo-inositol-1(or 4)-monophosphatase
VVFNPIDEDLFSAVSRQGTFRNGQPIRVSPYRRLNQSVLATGWPYDKKELLRVLKSLERLLPISQEVRAIFLTTLRTNLIGDWLRDLFDPHMVF